MKKIILLIIFPIIFSILFLVKSDVKAVDCYGQPMYAVISYEPTSVKQGEYFTLTVEVRNCTYKTEYEDTDVKLTNPGVTIQHKNYLQYLEPSSDWVLPLGSMENYQVLTFSKTYRLKENTPIGYFGGNSVVRWIDKNDSSTMDHLPQSGEPMKVIAGDNNYIDSNPSQGSNSQDQESQANQLMNKIELSAKYFEEGSHTTRLHEMSEEQLGNLNGFTLEIKNRAMVEFMGQVDLSSEERIALMNELDKYINMNEPGKIFVDTSTLTFLNLPAKIYMYNLSFKTTPLIYKDGVLVTSEEVKNIDYSIDENNVGTLSFEVVGFSTYEARENKDNINDEDSSLFSTYTEPESKNYSLLVILLSFEILLIIGFLGYYFLVKNIDKKKSSK